MIYNPLIYMKKVLVIGGGGREHAIVDALSRSPQVEKIFCAPGNAGISAQAECVAIKDTDVEGLKAFALENAMAIAKAYPAQMQDLIVMENAADFIGNRVAVMVLDILYGNGTFRPLAEEEKIAANLLVFSDVLPKV